MILIELIKNNILNQKLIRKGDTIIIGISGGADSVALTCILNEIKYEIGFQIHLAHLNHNFRNTSIDDENFVKELAQKLNLPLTVERWIHSKNNKITTALEEKARQKRLEFFKKISKKLKTKNIVLAHTQDDVAETVLMNLLRGSGPKGLRGIMSQREINDLTLIRPLINTSKNKLLKFLDSQKIDYVVDPTNLETNFTRNKIRLELLPMLRKNFNQNIDDNLTSMAKLITQDYDYLESEARKKYVKTIAFNPTKKTAIISKEKFIKLHPSMQNIIIRLVIENICGSMNKISAIHVFKVNQIVHSDPKVIKTLQLPYKIKVINSKITTKLYIS